MENTIVTRLGLKENAAQFWLLVLINGFVGAMVGLERSVIPALAETDFGISGHSALLSFIVAFGLAKSGANLLMGRLTTRFTRKQLLTTGWLFALPVPWLLLFAGSWPWVIVANILLGLNQGLAWSATVVMKIDLVGEKNRGLAMGINEFAGYLAVGLAAFLAGYLAAASGQVRQAFVPGIGFSVAGLLLSVFLVRDTQAHVNTETARTSIPMLRHLWHDTTWRHVNLGPVTFGGFVNNLNDGILWGLLPVLLTAKGYSLVQTGLLAGVYPVVWGLGQLITGRLGDVVCKKQLLSMGMAAQGMAIALLYFAGTSPVLIGALALLGAGTALVYPNFLAVVAENTHPSQRPQSLGIFRFWRDFGYVAGAVAAGVCSDAFGLPAVWLATAVLTLGAGILMERRMCCTKKRLWPGRPCPSGMANSR